MAEDNDTELYRVYLSREELDDVAEACYEAQYDELAGRIGQPENHELVDPAFEETLHNVLGEIVESMLERGQAWRQRGEELEESDDEHERGQGDAWRRAGSSLEGFAGTLRKRMQKRPDVEPEPGTEATAAGSVDVAEIRRTLISEFHEIAEVTNSETKAFVYIAREWGGYNPEEIAALRGVGLDTVKWHLSSAEDALRESDAYEIDDDQATLEDVTNDEE